MKKLTLISIILVTVITTGLFAQQPGDLDNTFDTDGIVTTAIGSVFDVANAVVIQPDGKIVVAGVSNNGTNNDFALTRYNANGSLDTSFSTDGKLTTAFGIGYDIGYSATLQPDGKIIVGGYAEIGSDIDFALARFLTDGTPDTSFSADGKVTTAIGGSDDYTGSIILQPDGKIILPGFSFNGSNYDFAIARYNTDGSLDTNFSTDGKLTTAIGMNDDFIYSAALQPDGKIVVGGFSNNGADIDLALARYNADGSIDSAFSADGKLTTAIGAANDYAYSIALQTDGKIVAAGFSYNGIDNDFALARYDTVGTLDTSFSSDGKVTTAIGTGEDWIYSAAIQSDGKIVAAGFSNNGSDPDFALARYNTDGSIDSSFSADGIVTTAVGLQEDVARSVTLQPDGKIVAAGESRIGMNKGFAVARYISTLAVGVINFSVSDNSVFIYPNPVEQNATLEYKLKNEEQVSIHLLDMQGKTIKTFIDNENRGAGKHTQAINLPKEISPGSYCIVISSARSRVTIKIVK